VPRGTGGGTGTGAGTADLADHATEHPQPRDSPPTTAGETLVAMTSTTRSLTLRSTGRRLVGAISAGAAVAVVGITAVPVGTAMAAGIHRGPHHLTDAARQATSLPASVLGATTASTVTYRHDGTRFVRA